MAGAMKTMLENRKREFAEVTISVCLYVRHHMEPSGHFKFLLLIRVNLRATQLQEPET